MVDRGKCIVNVCLVTKHTQDIHIAVAVDPYVVHCAAEAVLTLLRNSHSVKLLLRRMRVYTLPSMAAVVQLVEVL